MPYYFDPNLDNKDKEQQQIAQGVQLSGASPVANPAGATAQKQAQSRDVQSGSGFQNLDKYLSTNQASNFGGQVLGKVGEQIGQAGTQMQAAADQFKNQVGTSNVVPTQADISKAISNPESADAKQYQNWMNQSYQGPKNLGESQDTWNKYWSGAKQAQTSAGLLGNESGRFALLDQYFGKPSYGFGQKSLDNLLVQQSGLGEATKNLQNQATQLQAQGTAQAGQLQNLASQRMGEVNKSAEAARNAIGVDASGQLMQTGALSQEQQAVTQALDQANRERQSQQESLKANLASGKLTPEQAQALGISGNQSIYNLDLNNYLSNSLALNKNQIMTPEQQARIKALSNLAGVNDTFATGDLESKNAAYGFDVNRLNTDIGARQAQYQTILNDTMRNTPITVTNARGQKETMPLGAAQVLLDSGMGIFSNPSVRSEVNALRDKLKSQIDAQFGIGRTLGVG